ncbi:MAG: chitobiase/beta-hexosaminidase C-terminal domain-containing protein, partial [Methanobacterium paludis]|nr:chitobiase/beta-hexosaminidase C-terminal domain-containing protein [Methanobacterium paludis]
MTITVNPAADGSTDAVMVSFNNVCNGNNITSFDPVNGHIPDGTVVSFNSTTGSIDPVIAFTTNGTATTTFTSTTAGNCVINATTNNQTISISLTVPLSVSANITSGFYNASQNVVLTANDDNATIYYSVNGSALTKYTGPIIIESASTLSYIAMDSINSLYSPVYTQTYTIDTTAPVVGVNVSGGLFNSTQSVTLNATDDTNTKIYYTTDGSDPQTSGTRIAYTGPITIANTTTLKYTAVDAAGNWAATQTQTYTIDTIAPVVTVNETTGAFNTTQSVALTSDDSNATIYYTTDGSDPASSSSTRTQYTGPIIINTTIMLKYTAVDAAGNWAATQTQTYTIDTTVPSVKSVDPVNKAVNVAVDKVIKVAFNEAIKVGTGWFELRSSNGTVVQFTSSISGNVLALTPVSALSRGTNYSLILHTGSVTDLAGNNLAYYGTNFVTTTDSVAPTVKSVDPVNKAVNVAVNKVIKVTFSEAIKAGTSAFELKNSNGTTVQFTSSINGNVLTITPVNALNKATS